MCPGVPGRDETAANFVQCLSILEPELDSAGFARKEKSSGKGSGGYFEVASFGRDDRTFEVSLRYESLQPRYSLRNQSWLPHADYMRLLLGPAGGNRFPAFADDALIAAEALRHDLANHCDDFLRGDGSDFTRCYERYLNEGRESGIGRLRRAEEQLKRRS